MSAEHSPHGILREYLENTALRPATREEQAASRAAREARGGAGVILVDADGRIVPADDRLATSAQRCYVQE